MYFLLIYLYFSNSYNSFIGYRSNIIIMNDFVSYKMPGLSAKSH